MKFSKIPFNQIVMIGVMAGLMAGCNGQAAALDPTPTAISSKSTSPIVSATGEVVPARWTTLSFTQAGTVIKLPIQEGNGIKSGDVIAQLDTADLKANLAQKQATVKTAEAQLAQVTAAPRADEVQAAKEAVAAANARIVAATAQRDRLYSGIAQADIIQAQAQVYAAQAQIDQLQKAMDKIISIGGRALSAGESLDNYLKAATLQRAAAQSLLDSLIDGPTRNQLRMANAGIALATSQATAAQAQLDLLMAGSMPQDIAVAKAKVDQAKAEVAEAQVQLDQTKMTAPFDGTIARMLIDANQFVGPGQPIAQLAELAGLRVETTDLNESDVARVNVGDLAKVTFDALPGVEISGKVTRIAPKAKEGTGVNYTVVIQLDQIPDTVRWGMTANADISVK
jgi:HlyD family secretion protein